MDLILPFFFTLFFHIAHALLNVSVDDGDLSMITYQGKWELGSPNNLDFGGCHRYSEDAAASATFTFTGVAVFYLAPRWPYAVSTQLSLDGRQAVFVNLTDPTVATTEDANESAEWSVAWADTGLENTTHTLLMNRPLGGEFTVVDGFFYTVDNDSLSSASASSGTGFPAPSSAPQSTDTASPGHLGLGVALGVAGLIATGSLVFFLWRRNQRRVQDESKVDAYPSTPVGVVTHDPQGIYASPFRDVTASSGGREKGRLTPERMSIAPPAYS
ncbi:hypothetical protein B0H11DRAFT_2387121 [Mycena galericulata]|nr:hypothetical protein B0H11DRAFT_2387121 [Mycena galericulata]